MKFFIDAYPLYDHDYNIQYHTHHLFFTEASRKDRRMWNIRHMGMCYPNADKTCLLIKTSYTVNGMTYTEEWETPVKNTIAGLRAILKEARKHEAKMDK